MLKEFIEFCRAKPAELEYDYGDEENCPIQQFANLKGIRYEDTPWSSFDAVAHGNGELQTWGALVKRLEALP